MRGAPLAARIDPTLRTAWVLGGALLLVYAIGLFGRNLWNPDELREADIAWRMSWQTDLAVPSLAGHPFCEKPPLTYWIAAASIGLFGANTWAIRLPNLLYALITAWALATLARQWGGARAAATAAVASATLLLSYQTGIWLATDAPLAAAVAVALLGLSRGFYAADRRRRLHGYLLMHAALAAGFFCKSLAAWMVPALCLVTLAVWERRWREMFRWELWIGALLQAAVIAPWIGYVYVGPDGVANLKVFFWNNLVGRFADVDAPPGLQYSRDHRNSFGKYLYELPLYLWPWTLLVMAAARRAWLERASLEPAARLMRLGIGAFLPALMLLSFSATARNVYLAPAMLGIAVLLAWWAQRSETQPDRFETGALRATAVMLLIATVLALAVLAVIGYDAFGAKALNFEFLPVSIAGAIAAAALAVAGWRHAGRGASFASLAALALAYCALLIGPVSQAYWRMNAWQDLAGIAKAAASDTADNVLFLFQPDETTIAAMDLFGRRTFSTIAEPTDARAIVELKTKLQQTPAARALVLLPGRALTPALAAVAARFKSQKYAPGDEVIPPWIAAEGLAVSRLYLVPNGRRYALVAAR